MARRFSRADSLAGEVVFGSGNEREGISRRESGTWASRMFESSTIGPIVVTLPERIVPMKASAPDKQECVTPRTKLIDGDLITIKGTALRTNSLGKDLCFVAVRVISTSPPADMAISAVSAAVSNVQVGTVIEIVFDSASVRGGAGSNVGRGADVVRQVQTMSCGSEVNVLCGPSPRGSTNRQGAKMKCHCKET